MNKLKITILTLLLTAIMSACVSNLPAVAREAEQPFEDCPAWIAGIHVSGKGGEYLPADASKKEWKTIGVRDVGLCLMVGDTVRTHKGGGVAILMDRDESDPEAWEDVEMWVLEESEFVIGTSSKKSGRPDEIEIDAGHLLMDLHTDGEPDETRIRVRTPSGVVGVKGTEFDVVLDEKEDKSTVHMLNGKVEITDKDGNKLAEPWEGRAVDFSKGENQAKPYKYDYAAYRVKVEEWKAMIPNGRPSSYTPPPEKQGHDIIDQVIDDIKDDVKNVFPEVFGE